MRKIVEIGSWIILAVFMVIIPTSAFSGSSTMTDYIEQSVETIEPIPTLEVITVPTRTPEPTPTATPEPTPEPTPELQFDENEVYLIALMTMTEAEGEPEDGKRMVIDTALNRVDHKAFPDTVYDVIYQPHQFSGMTGNRLEKCKRAFENDSELKEYFCQLVREEMIERMNYDVIFFHAKKYIQYGTPMFSIGNHYFSRY